jgi:hypothetical protein
MVVDDGTVEALFEEAGIDGAIERADVNEDPYEETRPEKVLAYLQRAMAATNRL